MASNGKTGNYIDALQRGDWRLPYGFAAARGDRRRWERRRTRRLEREIAANAERLIPASSSATPRARVLMVGTLARGAHDGGGRRTEVDTLLGTVADRHGLPFVSVGDWLTRYDLPVRWPTAST